MTEKGDRKRCKWAESDPLLREYHDREWGVPLRDSRAMWEMLMLSLDPGIWYMESII